MRQPPVPANADLRHFRAMPLDVVSLFNSDTWNLADGWQAKAAMNLWMRAWHQVPAGSLPNDDALLRAYAAVPDWPAVRAVALRGFVECSDGRLYHIKVCDQVLIALGRSAKATKAAKAKWKKEKLVPASALPAQSERTAKIGEDRIGEDSKKKKDGASAPPVVQGTLIPIEPQPSPDADLYRRGREVLGKAAGGVVKKLITAQGGSVPKARAAIETASTKNNPLEYIGAIIRGREREAEDRFSTVDPRL